MSIYDFQVKDASGAEKSLAEYQDKVVLIVNTASKCGNTPQYKGLEELYEQWHAQGLEILGFPCDQFGHQEPGSDAEIQEFCQMKYGVSFPVFAKIEVNGDGAHPLYQYLRSECKGNIKWNFAKFLVDRSGAVVGRYAPSMQPEELALAIEKLVTGGAVSRGGDQLPKGECE